MDEVMRADKDCHVLKRETQNRAGLVEQLSQAPAPKAQGLCSVQQCWGLLAQTTEAGMRAGHSHSALWLDI